MNCLKTFLALCFLLLLSCVKEEPKKIITWEDFPETHQLKGIKIPLPKPKQMPPQRIDNLRVLRDGIVLLEFGNYTNRTPKYLGILFDLKGGQVLQNIFPTGRGSNEFLEANFLHNDYDYSDGKLLSFMDSERSKIFTYHLDSLLKHGEVAAPLKVLDYKSEVLRQGIGRLSENDYICYNPYYELWQLYQ